MAVEPQVFICYGRPDKNVAHALAAEFWRNRIECYNYMGKPVEDRLGTTLPHLSYVYCCRLFIAIISKESISRFHVAEEIVRSEQMASLSEGFFRVHILTDVEQSPFPVPDLFVNWARSAGPAAIVKDLLYKMGAEFVEKNQKAWEINKGLYVDKWKELNSKYTGETPDA